MLCRPAHATSKKTPITDFNGKYDHKARYIESDIRNGINVCVYEKQANMGAGQKTLSKARYAQLKQEYLKHFSEENTAVILAVLRNVMEYDPDANTYTTKIGGYIKNYRARKRTTTYNLVFTTDIVYKSYNDNKNDFATWVGHLRDLCQDSYDGRSNLKPFRVTSVP